MTTLEKVENYHTLLDQVRTFLGGRRENNNCSSNAGLLQTYWNIGEYIVLSEQEGKDRATYGIRFLQRMSAHLGRKFGIGFSRSNLIYMRRFFLFFPLRDTFSTKLSWSHYFEILKTNEAAAITFYINKIEKFNWSVRHLKQQIKNGLHHCVMILSYKTPSKPKRPKRQSFLAWCLEQRKLKLQKAEKNSEKRETLQSQHNINSALQTVSPLSSNEAIFSKKRETLSTTYFNNKDKPALHAVSSLNRTDSIFFKKRETLASSISLSNSAIEPFRNFKFALQTVSPLSSNKASFFLRNVRRPKHAAEGFPSIGGARGG